MLCITLSQVLLRCIRNVPAFLYLLQKTMCFSGAGLYLTNFSISIPSLVPGINNLPRNINGINEVIFFFSISAFKSLTISEATLNHIAVIKSLKGPFPGLPSPHLMPTRGLPTGRKLGNKQWFCYWREAEVRSRRKSLEASTALSLLSRWSPDISLEG